MKKYAVMAFIAFLTISCTLSAQDNNRRGGQDGNRGQQREMRQNNQRETRQRANAQTRPATQERATAQQRAENMARRLELTSEQQTQVQALLERQDEQIRQTRQQNQQAQRQNQEEMRATRQRITAEHNAELEKIIGTEKMEQVRRMRAEQNSRRTEQESR